MAFPWNGNVIFGRCVLWVKAIFESGQQKKLSKLQLLVQPVTKVSSKWHFLFYVSRKSIRLHQFSTGLLKRQCNFDYIAATAGLRRKFSSGKSKPTLHLRFKMTKLSFSQWGKFRQYDDICVSVSVWLMTSYFSQFRAGVSVFTYFNTGNPDWHTMTLTSIARSNLRCGPYYFSGHLWDLNNMWSSF